MGANVDLGLHCPQYFEYFIRAMRLIYSTDSGGNVVRLFRVQGCGFNDRPQPTTVVKEALNDSVVNISVIKSKCTVSLVIPR